MLKLPLLYCCLFTLTITASAQRQNVYFFNNKNEYVQNRDSATYLRIVKEPAQNSQLYNVIEFYLDGTTKSTGYSNKIDPPQYEGEYVAYYENGNKKRVAHYQKGKPVDTLENYFPNGKLYSRQVYGSDLTQQDAEIYYKTVRDSTGKDLVIDGNGEAVFYDGDFKKVTDKGNIRNGQYEGLWTGSSANGKLTYTENYEAGKLVSGESKDEQGKTYHYTKVNQMPTYKGGMNKFYNYLKNTISYSKALMAAGATGTVIVRFTVMTDGTLSNIKVINQPNPELAAEALRVMKKSPNWEPGVWRGQPVSMFFNIPISFSGR